MNGQKHILDYGKPNMVELTLEEIPCIIPQQTYILNLDSEEQIHIVDNIEEMELCNEENIAFSVNPLDESVNEKYEENEGSNGVNLKVLNNSIIITTDEINDSKKPLGTCENPIEIIQNGTTLQSTQNLSREHLQQIAQALQQMNSDKEQEVDDEYIFEYEIVYPEDLDVKPLLTNHSKRGRKPKKRSTEGSEQVHIEEEAEPVVIKKIRTRSGRITKPPRYIEKDCGKVETIEINNVEKEEKNLESVENIPKLTPLSKKTEETNINNNCANNVENLEVPLKKRQIAAQFRCPICKKAYLGRSRMVKHLQKNPSHNKFPDFCKPKQDVLVWNFLVDLALKCPVGKRGFKFCNEFINLLKNAKILAKVLFKQPSSCSENLVYVDDYLSTVLGIKSGKYVLNDSEIIKDVSIFTLLDIGSNNFTSETFNFQNNFNSIQNELDENSNSFLKSDNKDQNPNEINNHFPSFKYLNKNNDRDRDLQTPSPNFETENEKSKSALFNSFSHSSLEKDSLNADKFLIDFLNDKKINSDSSQLKDSTDHKNSLFSGQFNCENPISEDFHIYNSSEKVLDKNSINSSQKQNDFTLTNSKFTESVLNVCNFNVNNSSDSNLDNPVKTVVIPKMEKNNDLNDCNTQSQNIIVKNEEVEKNKTRNFSKHIESPKYDDNHLQYSSASFVDSIQRISLNTDQEFASKEDVMTCLGSHNRLISNTKQTDDDFSLLTNEKRDFDNQNSLNTDLLSENSLLNSLSRSTEELMTFSNVDSHHIPIFLDNSASSDEIINVDQFVNERFKTITEPELDLSNTSISLDLQTMDLFPFNSN